MQKVILMDLLSKSVTRLTPTNKRVKDKLKNLHSIFEFSLFLRSIQPLDFLFGFFLLGWSI